MMNIVLMILIFLLGTSGKVHGMNDNDGELRDELHRRISEIVKDIDPFAKVSVVTSREQKSSDELATIPFVFKSTRLMDTKEPFASIKVHIMTSRRELPLGARSLINEIIKPYGQRIDITSASLPSDYVLQATRAKEMAIPKTMKAAPITLAVPERPWEKDLIQTLAEIKSSLKIKQVDWHAVVRSLKPFVALIAGLFAIIFLLGLAGHYAFHRKIIKTMESSVTKISDSLDTRPMNHAIEKPRDLDIERRPTQVTSSPSVNISSYLEAMNFEGLMNLLADCYWTEHDAYAAFLWKQLSPKTQMKVLQELSYFSEYAAFLSGLEDEDLSLHTHPCYLYPLKVQRINSDKLTQVVRSHPHLYYLLSPMRQASLMLTISEKLKMADKTVNGAGQSSQKSAEAVVIEGQSKPRKLPTSTILSISSVEEEAELLAMQNLSIETIEQIPSLIWLMYIEASEIQSLLSRISAKDLASAWIGPPSVLDHLASLIGPKKLEMVRSHLEKITPSRESLAMQQIHNLIIEELHKRETLKKGSPSIKQSGDLYAAS